MSRGHVASVWRKGSRSQRYDDRQARSLTRFGMFLVLISFLALAWVTRFGSGPGPVGALIDTPTSSAAPPPLLSATTAAAAVPAATQLEVPKNALNVRDFGAKGTGAVNDQPAIQKAVDAAKPGDTIYFPAGTYWVDGVSIKVRKSNLTFLGEGPASVIQHGWDVGFLFGGRGEPLTGLAVLRLRFRGAPGKYVAHGNYAGAIVILGPKGTLIENCEFIGSGLAVSNGSITGTTYGTIMRNCKVLGWGAQAVFCNGGEQIENCTFIQDDPKPDGSNKSEHGFYIHSGCKDITISDTLVENARWYGAQIYGSDIATTSERITFRRVTFKNCKAGLVIVSGSVNAARAKDILVEDCSFSGIYDGAAIAVKQGDRITIRNNFVDGADRGLQVGAWGSWEQNYSITDMQATGNVIKNCRIGIWAVANYGGQLTNVSMSDNTMVDCQTPVDISKAPGISYAP